MILQKFFNTISGNEIDDEFYEDLEEVLIMADTGIETTQQLIDELRDAVNEKKIKKTDACKQELKRLIRAKMALPEDAFEKEQSRTVYMLIGVNGTGKTTTSGKLAAGFVKKGKKVLLAAADTFRAAAIEQLSEWASRSGAEIIASSEGSDPGAVLYDACAAARARNTDIMIVDTAGRLHNKKNLMSELKKLYGIIDKEYPEAKRETLVVLDATTGQNAIEQVRQFSEAADITGIVLTKMDGTAKGGIAVAIQAELGYRVKYIGYGEKTEDLKHFDVDEYIEKIFG